MTASHTGALPSRKPQRSVRDWLTHPRTREALTAYLFLSPFLILFAVFVLRSIVYAGYMSTFDWRILSPTQTNIGLRNYQELLNDPVWWEALRNTVIFAVYTVVLTVIVALCVALILHSKPRGSGVFRSLFYAPAVLSVSVVAICWLWLMNTDFGVINYGLTSIGLDPVNWTGDPDIVLLTLSIVTVWWGFGFPMLVMLAGLQNIPDTLIEAAKLDGAGRLQVFLYITLPLLRPTILFITVTGFIAHFQVFGQPYLMTNGGGPGRASYTALMYLYEAAWEAFRMGYAAAVAFTLTLILVVITLIQFLFIGRRVDS
jgi:multiple sugar transport system permease protein